jgi:hypothetical protein
MHSKFFRDFTQLAWPHTAEFEDLDCSTDGLRHRRTPFCLGSAQDQLEAQTAKQHMNSFD